MKKLIVLLAVTGIFYFANGQTKITWLGVDFSHVKLIGDFNQFAEAGHKSSSEIQNKYFRSWNMLFITEADKFSIKEVLRQEDVFNDIDMVIEKSLNASPDSLASYNSPNYSKEDIGKFIKEYTLDGKEGTGVLLLAESLNKGEEAAVFHFVAMDIKSRSIIIHERFKGKPGGFGLRNYWGGAIDDVLHQVKKKKYKI